MRFSAEFKFLKLPDPLFVTRMAPDIPGPFRVEVYSLNAPANTKWGARFLPTHQVIKGKTHKTAQDCMINVESMFREQLSPWAEYVFA